MAELRNRRSWEIEIRDVLINDGFAVESEETGDEQTTLRVRLYNGQRYQLVVTPLE